MTREQIEDKAMEIAKEVCGSFDAALEYANGFAVGAQWRINSVWHKPNEETISYFHLMLYEYTNGEFELGYAFDPARIRRWAFVKDLLPERKEETE